jgi:hypothetical protein
MSFEMASIDDFREESCARFFQEYEKQKLNMNNYSEYDEMAE